jgi:hypothetical protein
LKGTVWEKQHQAGERGRESGEWPEGEDRQGERGRERIRMSGEREDSRRIEKTK